MTNTPPASGADLARQALAAARANARNTPAPRPKKTRRSTLPARGEGRDPQGLGNILGRLTAEQGWDAGLGGGSVIDRWPDLCPQYVGLVQPVHYDDPTGRLDLRPGSHSYAAQLRLLGGQLAKQINDKMGRPVVRTIRVLPVGNLTPIGHQTAPTTAGQDSEAPVETRKTASAGYRAALDAALAHRPERQPTNPYVLEAMAAQEAALRSRRQPESEHREAVWAQTDAAADPAPGSMEASEQAALAYKRREQVGLTVPRRVFDVA